MGEDLNKLPRWDIKVFFTIRAKDREEVKALVNGWLDKAEKANEIPNGGYADIVDVSKVDE